MIAALTGPPRLAAIVVGAGLACGASFALVSHQRDVAVWRESAVETASRIGAHLEHTIRDVAIATAGIAADGRRGLGRLPRLVAGVQVVVEDRVVVEAHRVPRVPEFLDCSEHASARAGPTIVAYRWLPELVLAACMALGPSPVESSGHDRWLVVWIDREELFRSAGLRSLTRHGFDYRLLDVSKAVEAPLEASVGRRGSPVVRYEIALPANRWVLELEPRESEKPVESLIGGGVLVALASGWLGLLVFRLGSDPDRLRSELAASRRQALGLESRLTREHERRRSAEARIEDEARYDHLTRLPNRSLFVEKIDDAIEVCRNRSASTAVALFDVEQLRRINETLGRAVGDQVLRAVARRIESALRPLDLLARAGADQFGVLRFDAPDVEEATRFAAEVQSSLKKPLTFGGTEVYASCRVGIVMLTGSYRRADDVLRDATIALNQARASDDQEVQVFGREMHARAVRLLDIETDLRRAVERGEMVAYYQPILSLGVGRIVGFETLARWRHPERGIVSPADFIPIAERTGLIIDIDRWNIAEGVRQLARWQKTHRRDPPLKLSANLAANELSRPDIVDFVASVLEGTRIDPGSLALEVTESGVMKNPESAAEILNGLSALGVHLHLDDFGTGYSSLAYLHRFSFQLIKIDRAFVGRMTSDRKSYELVKTVIALARALEMGIVAEGIETQEQLAELRSLGCEMGQGFLFSKPQPHDVIEKLVTTNPVW